MGIASSYCNESIKKMTMIADAHTLDTLFDQQLAQWDLAQLNYNALSQIEVRNIEIDGIEIRIQHNPGRITSVASTLRVEGERPCFLCNANLPHEQIKILYGEGDFNILVNPYPIFNKHFTIAATTHTPQRIKPHNNNNCFATLLKLAQDCSPYTFFYNGAKCGASAPMHLHFQAGEAGYMPIERQWLSCHKDEIYSQQEAQLFISYDMLRPVFSIEGNNEMDISVVFDKLYKAMSTATHEEPMMNIITFYSNNKWVVLIFPRKKHRPDCYYYNDESQRLISPGAVEMGGVIIVPRKQDFQHLTTQEIKAIYQEVTPHTDIVKSIIRKIQ